MKNSNNAINTIFQIPFPIPIDLVKLNEEFLKSLAKLLNELDI